MEENRSMSEINKIKDYNKSVFSYRKTDRDMKFKEEINGQESFGHEFSWPPRSYTCTFCKKEFRSAQALGGHMNVHRREKAKLRQINPIRYLPFLYPQSQHFSSNSKFLDLNLNLDPNPNPNPNPSISTSFSSNTSSFPTMLPPLTYSSMSHPLIHRLCPSNWASFSTFRSRKSDIILDGFEVEKESTMNIKKSATGLLVESKFDDLDLELRLGCS